MGIATLLGGVSLLGWIVCLSGIGLIVITHRPVRAVTLLAGVGGLIGLVGSVMSQGILIVEPQQIAVVFNTASGQLEEPRRAGTYVIVPLIQEVSLYPIGQQQFTVSGQDLEELQFNDESVRARTADGQEVFIDGTIIYSINPDEVNRLHQRWQNRYPDQLVGATLNGLIRDGVSQSPAEDIYGTRRNEVENAIEQALAARLAEESLILTDFIVRNATFSPQYVQAIEFAQIAQQQAEQAELRVQQRLQEAEQARTIAAGQRDAVILRAEGEAESRVIKARAAAEALQLVSEQIAQNPYLIQYQYIRNLAENVRLVLFPASSTNLFEMSAPQNNPTP